MLLDALVERYPTATLRDGEVRMVWACAAPSGQLRVGVRLSLADVEGATVLEALAEIAYAVDIDAADALAINRTLRVGALALDGDVCVLRHAMELGTFEWPELDRVLVMLSERAARLKHSLRRWIHVE
jgi:hypothetical protein